MMALPNLTILDVGHGNCAILQDHNGTFVFDAGPGSTLNDYLQDTGIREISALLISHSDADHLSGAINLLSSPEFRVRTLYMNPDSGNRSDTYQLFRIAVRDAREHRNTQVHTQLNTTLSGVFRPGATTVEILSPAPETALGGPQSYDLEGRTITRNSMSAVIRLQVNGNPGVLLPGDMDAAGLADLRVRYPSIRAKVLVFPHHGGRPGRSNPSDFARELCDRVKPELVVFSIGRGKHNTPNVEIVDAVRQQCPKVHIACTQLSTACAIERPPTNPSHLLDEISAGKRSRSCCIGTLVLSFSPEVQSLPVLQEHSNFIDHSAPTALCRRNQNF